MSVTPQQLLANGLRVLLTPGCNYGCYFCHNEGLDRGNGRHDSIDPDIVLAFVRAGVRDLTLSGGEPLHCFDAIRDITTRLVDGLAEDRLRELDLTVVTNGSLLDAEKVARFAALSGRLHHFKLNVSLHAADERVYDVVTGTSGRFSDVKRNIREAIAAGLDVRLNCVLLKDRNAAEEDIEAMLSLAGELGVSRIKLIELLITDRNRDHYSSLVCLDSLLHNYKHRAAKIAQKNPRCTSYLLQPENVMVDFVRCTCALGCSACGGTRELELLPGNVLMPCMHGQARAIDARGRDPLDLAREALGQLQAMAEEYGNYSPSLVAPPETVAGKAVFPVSATPAEKGPSEAGGIRLFRRYERREFLHRAEGLLRPSWQFVIEHLEGDGHSRLLCYSERVCRREGLSWNDITFMDPVYEFSRTRAEVNERKMECMGYVASRVDHVTEDTLVLSPGADGQVEAYYRKRRYAESGRVERRLEICRKEGGGWPEGEPLHTAEHLAAEHGLRLLPFGTPETEADEAVRRLCERYAALCGMAEELYALRNDEGHRADHALRVARNLFAIASEEGLDLAGREDTCFLAALLHDIDRTSGRGHAAASAREAERLLGEHGVPDGVRSAVGGTIERHSHRFVGDADLSPEQRLLQDADFLDCFALEMIPRACLHGSNGRALRDVLEHLAGKCLRAERADFHFEATRRWALPGWLLLRAFVVRLDAGIGDVPVRPAFFDASGGPPGG